MNLHLYLFCFVILVSLAGIQPSSAHPASNARPLKREKRIRGCSEVSLSDESLREWKHAPKSLELAVEAGATEFPVDRKWSHFVQVFVGEGSWEREKGVGGRAEVCDGWVEGDQRSDVVLVKKTAAGSTTPQLHYILFSSSLSLSHTLTVWFSCPSTPPQCFHLLSEGSTSRLRRNVQNTHSLDPHSSHASDGEGVKWGVGVGVSIVGLVGVLAALAMCTHSAKSYDPDAPNNRSSEVADTSEPIATKSDSQVDLLNSDSMSKEQSIREQASGNSEGKSVTVSTADSQHSNEDKQLSSQQSGSEEPLLQSKDTSPDLPTLDTVDNGQKVTDNNAGNSVNQEEDGEEAGYASVTKPHTEQKNGYAYVDTLGEANQNEDEAGYAYATVGGARDEGTVQQPKEGDKEKGSALPSYGKVTRHMVPVSTRGSYSEVRTTSSPMLPPGRPRAVTEPIDPVDNYRGGMKDDRGLTESAAHLPLPQIPQFKVSTDDSPRGARVAQPNDTPPMRESVYESVEGVNDPTTEEGDEDMYESVPEDLRQTAVPTSPTLSPSSPVPPPPRSPSGSFKVIDTPTPPSPKLVSAKKKNVKEEEDGKKKSKEHAKSEQKKHKALSKAKSDSGGTDSRGRSLSSLFSRKKGSSGVEYSPSPKLKREKDQHEPLPQVPPDAASSPTHLLPPSPPHIPPPCPPDEEFEDDPPDSAYDMIEDINPRGAALLRARNAKEKSASLPSSMRAASASILQAFDHGPLPEVPEESAGGVVARQRMKETMDPEYDTVVLGQVMDEPNYDCVEFPNVENASEDHGMPKLEPAEPGGPEDINPERGLTPTKYAKVTSHTAVETPATPDHRAHSPDHDELGYAVIPAHLKMRKRAMSDALKKREQEITKNRSMSVDDPTVQDSDGLDTQEPEYESVTDEMRGSALPAAGQDTEIPYATVDMAAKRRSQLLRQQGAGGTYAPDSEAVQSLSPPPLPNQGDLGDLSEFQQPPVPIQLEESLKLIDSSDPPYSRILPPPGQGGIVNPYSQIDVLLDPPYASVKKKTEGEDGTNDSQQEGEEENPYATVDNVTGEVETAQNPNDPPYAKIKKGKVVEDEEAADDPIYENTGSNLPAEDAVDSTITNGEHEVEGQREEDAYDQVDQGQREEDAYDQLDHGQGEEDAYDRLDHGFGNAATCRAMATSPSHVSTECSTALSPGGDTEYSTIKLDFDNCVSPELVVTPEDNPSSVVNGSIDTEERVIDFTN